MKKIFAMILVTIVLTPLFSATFEKVDARTSGKDKIEFPKDILSSRKTIFAFVLSDSREGGETQQQHLLTWHKSLVTHPSFPQGVNIYHLPVIEDPPGFVKGFIRKGLGETYKGFVDDDKVAVLFVDDAASFATKAGLPFSNSATVVVVDNKGAVKGYATGEVTNEKLQSIIALL